MTITREEILSVVTSARSARSFDSNHKISDEDWETLLTVAQQAPSSNSLEAWRIIEVNEPEIRRQLIEVAPGEKQQLATADKFVFFAAVSADENSAYAWHMQKDLQQMPDDVFAAWQQRLYGLHHNLLNISFDTWLERQATIPIGQMTLAASLLGIDSCMMEGFFYSRVAEILTAAGLLNPEEERLATGVAFGYSDFVPKREKIRRPLDEIVKK